LENNGLTEAEVKTKIETYLDKRGVKYQKNVPLTNRKSIDYVFKNNSDEIIGIYLLLWKRPISYRKIFDMIEWTKTQNLQKIILVCRIMGERAREVLEKDPANVSYILESWFRKMDYNPLLAAF
jgi:hypothetical protein